MKFDVLKSLYFLFAFFFILTPLSKSFSVSPFAAYEEGGRGAVAAPSLSYRRTGLESIGIGALSGALETTLNYPLWGWKTRLQTKEKMTLNPRILYKGVLNQVGMMSVITSARLGFKDALVHHCFEGKEITSAQNLMASFMGGVGASPLTSVSEFVGIQQQVNYGKPQYETFFSTLKEMKKQGIFTFGRGAHMACLSGGLITFCSFGLTPELARLIAQGQEISFQDKLLPGLLSGFLAAVFSQPFDTIKTLQQSAPLNEKGKSSLSLAQKIFAEEGVKGLYRGLSWRTARLIIGVPFVFYSTEILTDLYSKGL